VAAGDAEDAERAVAAAREAFEGPWRTLTPAARQSIVWAVADAVEAHYEELRRLEAFDRGLPLGRAPGAGASQAVEVLRYFAGWATKLNGETLPNSMPWSVFTSTLPEPVGAAVWRPLPPGKARKKTGCGSPGRYWPRAARWSSSRRRRRAWSPCASAS